MDEERRQKIIDEFMDVIEIEDAPAHAMTRAELKKTLGIGDVALVNALEELERQGILNKAKTYRINKIGRRFQVQVFWFGDEPNTLHSQRDN